MTTTVTKNPPATALPAPDHSKALDIIVAEHRLAETGRNRDSKPLDNAEVTQHLSSAPSALMSSLSVAAAKLRISRSVLTKCATHQIISWYGLGLGLDETATEYNKLYEEVRKQPRCIALRRQMDNRGSFSLIATEPVSTSIATNMGAAERLRSYGRMLRATWVDLFLAGLARSITTLQDCEWDTDNIKQFFEPEIENVMIAVQDIQDDMECYAKKLQRRLTSKAASHFTDSVNSNPKLLCQ